MVRVSAIAIISKNRGLGKDNKLLFHIKGELPRFKQITMGHPVIMGRKTYESIGKPLPGRVNIVVTKDTTFARPGIHVCHTITDAIAFAKEKDSQEIFIIGGGQIYQEALPYTDRLYLTIVDKAVAADTYFPDYTDFPVSILEEKHTDGDVSYIFTTLERRLD